MQKQRWRRREPDGYSGADKLTVKPTREFLGVLLRRLV
jgi:hypothetical protein